MPLPDSDYPELGEEPFNLTDEEMAKETEPDSESSEEDRRCS